MKPRRFLPARRHRPDGSVLRAIAASVLAVTLMLVPTPSATADERFAPVPPPGLQLAPPSPFEIGLRELGYHTRRTEIE